MSSMKSSSKKTISGSVAKSGSLTNPEMLVEREKLKQTFTTLGQDSRTNSKAKNVELAEVLQDESKTRHDRLAILT